MSKYIFNAGYNNDVGNVKVKLLLIHFVDENNIHFIYSPHLDLTGYGNNLDDAKKSFEIVFEDFVDYTLNKRTIGKVLTNLGWGLKGSVKKPKKIIAPSITSIIGENDYVSEIFDKYSTDTYHKEVDMPIYA